MVLGGKGLDVVEVLRKRLVVVRVDVRVVGVWQRWSKSEVAFVRVAMCKLGGAQAKLGVRKDSHSRSSARSG